MLKMISQHRIIYPKYSTCAGLPGHYWTSDFVHRHIEFGHQARCAVACGYIKAYAGRLPSTSSSDKRIKEIHNKDKQE